MSRTPGTDGWEEMGTAGFPPSLHLRWAVPPVQLCEDKLKMLNHLHLPLFLSLDYCSNNSRLADTLGESGSFPTSRSTTEKQRGLWQPAGQRLRSQRHPDSHHHDSRRAIKSSSLCQREVDSELSPNHTVLGKCRDNSGKIGADINSLQGHKSSREPVAPGRRSASW